MIKPGLPDRDSRLIRGGPGDFNICLTPMAELPGSGKRECPEQLVAHSHPDVHNRFDVLLHDAPVQIANSSIGSDVVEGHYAVLFHRIGKALNPRQIKISAGRFHIRHVVLCRIRYATGLFIFHVERTTIDLQMPAQLAHGGLEHFRNIERPAHGL